VHGEEIVTYELEYPRYIHAQVLTHRVFSRNSASSRAIPMERVIAQIMKDGAKPYQVRANESGMQGHKILGSDAEADVVRAWEIGRDAAIECARAMARVGAHKQTVNRYLEPYQTIKVVLTGTDFVGWFAQRISKHAQPEICSLASRMRYALHQSVPRHASMHLPYISDRELLAIDSHDISLVSAARCARVSYRGESQGVKADLRLAARLYEAGHMSPFEHPAVCFENAGKGGRYDNFTGWQSIRNGLANADHIPNDGEMVVTKQKADKKARN